MILFEVDEQGAHDTLANAKTDLLTIVNSVVAGAFPVSKSGLKG